MSNALSARGALSFSHMGFYVRDLAHMARFYTEVMGFFVTDRGLLGAAQLVFLSRDPSEHHQIVLASGRPNDLSFNVINQISLRVPDLATPPGGVFGYPLVLRTTSARTHRLGAKR
jgi:catechol 2,3-dioxygenase